jgi:hypothetical protein
MNLSSMNRRHRAGLFFILALAGVTLIFDASAKQTAGVVLLGIAATWLLGSLSLRALGLITSLGVCIAGIFVIATPIRKDWKSFQASIQDYDSAVFDLRQELALGFIPDTQNQEHGPWEKYGQIQQPTRPEANGPTHSHSDIRWRIVEIPKSTQRWEGPDPKGVTTSIRFPDDMTDERIVQVIQQQMLVKPTFSLKASLAFHRVYLLIGLALTVVGLFSLGWAVHEMRTTKSAA